MGVAISDLAAGLARDGEAGNRGPVASQGLSALLAVAIKIAPDWSAEDEHRDPPTDPPDEHFQPHLGAPRIHGELLMLGIEVSQATVGRYMPWRPKVPSPTWRSFLRNHMRNMAALDMFVVATATFRLLYTLIVLGHDRRRIIHFEVTQNPTQIWLARQMTEAFPWDTAPRYLLRDRDASYGQAFRDRVEAMAIKEVVTAAQSPWQNPYVERVIGSIRRECLNHIIIFDECHLRSVLSSYFHYYHQSRTHLSLDKDCPDTRPVHRPAAGKIIAFPEV